MRVSIPVMFVSWRVRTAVIAVLLALLAAIGGMQATAPVAAQEHITQAPTLPGSRNLTQAPRIGTAYYDAPRDRPDPLYIATAPRPSLDRPDPLYIPTLPR